MSRYVPNEFEKYLEETVSILRTDLECLQHILGVKAYLADDGSLDTVVEIVDKDEQVETYRFEGSSIWEVFSFDYSDKDLESCDETIANSYRILSCMVDALEDVKSNGFNPDLIQ